MVACIQSLVQVNLFTENDTVLQMASCSYDVHVQEILGSLIVGCTSVMLHPHGNMDLDYVVAVVKEKQVSYMQSVPAYVGNLLNLLDEKNQNALPALRTLDIGGKYNDWFVIYTSFEFLQEIIVLSSSCKNCATMWQIMCTSGIRMGLLSAQSIVRVMLLI